MIFVFPKTTDSLLGDSDYRVFQTTLLGDSDYRVFQTTFPHM